MLKYYFIFILILSSCGSSTTKRTSNKDNKNIVNGMFLSNKEEKILQFHCMNLKLFRINLLKNSGKFILEKKKFYCSGKMSKESKEINLFNNDFKFNNQIILSDNDSLLGPFCKKILLGKIVSRYNKSISLDKITKEKIKITIYGKSNNTNKSTRIYSIINKNNIIGNVIIKRACSNNTVRKTNIIIKRKL